MGKKFSVTDIYKTGELFSPNGDEVNETVALNYFVHEPVHLQLFVLDQDGALVRTFTRDHMFSGEYSVIWDGRNEAGGIVADGYYSIRLFDYEFFFQVDTKPPHVQLAFEPLACQLEPAISTLLSGFVVDENLKSWTLFYSEGQSTEEWYAVQSGESFLAQKDKGGEMVLDEAGNPSKALIQQFSSESSPSISFLDNRSFRLVGTDFAGNTSTVSAGFYEELLAIVEWDETQFELEPDGQGGWVIPNVLGKDYLTSGIHQLTAAETLKTPLVSAVVQYRSHMQWYEGSEVAMPGQGKFVVPFDTTSLNLEDIVAVRIKARDEAGRDFYSNIVKLKPPVFSASMGCIQENGVAPPRAKLKVSLLKTLRKYLYRPAALKMNRPTG